jgi:hypothetical protein
VDPKLGKEASLRHIYLAAGGVLAPFVALVVWIQSGGATPLAGGLGLLPPIFALVTLTAVVLGVAAVVRNVAVIRGVSSVRFYETYSEERPAEWVERPAKTFDNLFQVPMLFYIVCLLMMVTDEVDSIQVALAWLFVATRIVHAFVYIVFNRVPYRFAAFFSGVITLGVIWGRFASAVG